MLKHNDCIGACCIVQALPYPTVWQSWRIACYEVHQPLSSRLLCTALKFYARECVPLIVKRELVPVADREQVRQAASTSCRWRNATSWAADNVPQIFEAAENPVHGSRWWMQVRDTGFVSP